MGEADASCGDEDFQRTPADLLLLTRTNMATILSLSRSRKHPERRSMLFAAKSKDADQARFLSKTHPSTAFRTKRGNPLRMLHAFS